MEERTGQARRARASSSDPARQSSLVVLAAPNLIFMKYLGRIVTPRPPVDPPDDFPGRPRERNRPWSSPGGAPASNRASRQRQEKQQRATRRTVNGPEQDRFRHGSPPGCPFNGATYIAGGVEKSTALGPRKRPRRDASAVSAPGSGLPAVTWNLRADHPVNGCRDSLRLSGSRVSTRKAESSHPFSRDRASLRARFPAR